MRSHIARGKTGENIAAEHLQAQGYEVLDKNWRGNCGELDLVVRDHGVVVAVEVKTRSSLNYGHPFEAISETKARRLYSLIFEWLRMHRLPTHVYRVDAIAVTLHEGSDPVIEHVKAILA